MEPQTLFLAQFSFSVWLFLFLSVFVVFSCVCLLSEIPQKKVTLCLCMVAEGCQWRKKFFTLNFMSLYFPSYIWTSMNRVRVHKKRRISQYLKAPRSNSVLRAPLLSLLSRNSILFLTNRTVTAKNATTAIPCANVFIAKIEEGYYDQEYN